MQERKQNNSIQSAVNDLKEIPDGFQFRQDLLWDKLELNLPTRQKRILWYYSAAAIILISVSCAVFFLNTNHHTTVARQSAANFMIKEKTPQGSNRKQNSEPPKLTVFDTKQSPANKTEITAAVINQKQEASVLLPEKKIEQLPELATSENRDVAVTDIQDEKKPGELPVTIAKPPIKKIRVIHLNDLNKIMLPEFNVGKHDAKHPGFIPFEEIQIPAEPGKQILYFRVKTLPATTIVEN